MEGVEGADDGGGEDQEGGDVPELVPEVLRGVEALVGV